MKFGEFLVAEAEGLVLAHSLRVSGISFRKGRMLTEEDVSSLRAAGLDTVIGAMLGPTDVAEDAAAEEIAKAIGGNGIALSAARTGRCNLMAQAPGMIRVDERLIDRINTVSETVTVSTLPNYSAVISGQVVATVKIIPFAVEVPIMNKVRSYTENNNSIVALSPYLPRQFYLINTELPSLKKSVMESTIIITRERVVSVSGTLENVVNCPHTSDGIKGALAECLSRGAEFILISAASATVDRDDVAPAAVVAAGGVVDHVGMPVDPGNLLVIAHINDVPVLVMPGCARSPKLNGMDWVLQRLAAGISVTSTDVMHMGAGGLLVDILARPLPRRRAVHDNHNQPNKGSLNIAAVVLAAGQSRRMGRKNKLLADVGGMSLVRRTVETVVKSSVKSVVVVTGHQASDIKVALKELDVVWAHNDGYEHGLSTSIATGISALADGVDGVLVCLGDMPALEYLHINQLIEGFNPDCGHSIGVPVHRGKRGNPVLWPRQFFDEMSKISGDVGAKHLIGENVSLVYEVEFEDTAVLTDIDTPRQLSEYQSRFES